MLKILPNLDAARGMTMFGKWIIIFALKKDYTVEIHRLLCIGIAVLALASKFIHDWFLNAAFDIYDILIIVAQLIMFFLPILVKDKCFSRYS